MFFYYPETKVEKNDSTNINVRISFLYYRKNIFSTIGSSKVKKSQLVSEKKAARSDKNQKTQKSSKQNTQIKRCNADSCDAEYWNMEQHGQVSHCRRSNTCTTSPAEKVRQNKAVRCRHLSNTGGWWCVWGGVNRLS